MKFIILSLILSSCASSYKERVIETMDQKDRPEWADLTKTMYEKKGKIYALGISESPIDSRISALIRIADNNARYEISRFIQNEMGFIFQNVEEGTSGGSELSHYFSTEVSKTLVSGIASESRFYEKILKTNADGDKDLNYRTYALVSIKKGDLKRSVRRAMEKENQLSNALKAKVLDHLNTKIDSL